MSNQEFTVGTPSTLWEGMAERERERQKEGKRMAEREGERGREKREKCLSSFRINKGTQMAFNYVSSNVPSLSI